jgi:small-conductance mechanosensitive channel
MDLSQFLASVSSPVRIMVVILLAIFAQLVVWGLKQFGRWLLTPKSKGYTVPAEVFTRRHPKIATLTTILVSAATFVIYFLAIGLILREFKVSLTAYLASASVIGLAIGFGLQGFVQDVVIGLTLIFSDALNITDLVELSGQVGKVESIGLRFTTLVNLHGQEIYIPNRNIGMISRFRRGAIRAYVDVQLPNDLGEKDVADEIQSIASGMYSQHKSIILTQPEIFGLKETKGGNWRYLRIKFRLWPGQGALIENTFRQRVVAMMKEIYPAYADWMVTVTYKVE